MTLALLSISLSSFLLLLLSGFSVGSTIWFNGLFPTEPAGDAALGLRSLLLDRLVELVDLLERGGLRVLCVGLGVLRVGLGVGLRFGEFGLRLGDLVGGVSETVR